MLERALSEVAAHHGAEGRRSRTPSRRCATPAARRWRGCTPAPTPSVRAELAARPLRDYVSPSTAYPLLVERERALYGAWYEIFPRSEGAVQDPETGKWTSGTLRTAAERLPAIAADGLRRRLPDRRSTRSAPQRARARTTPSTPGPTTPAAPMPSAPPTAATTPSTPTSALRRLRLLRRAAERARAGGRHGHRAAGLPRPPLRRRRTPSGSPPAPTARSPTPRTRRRSTRTSTRSTSTTTRPGPTPRCAGSIQVLDRPRRQDLPRRQPAHQAGRVLAVAHRRRRHGPPRRHLAGRGVHQAGDDARASPRSGFQQSYTYYTWRNRSGSSRSTSRELAGDAAAYMRPNVLAHDARHPHALHAVRRARPPGSCVPPWPRRWCRPTASTPATSSSSTSPARAPRSRSTTRSTSTRTGTGRTTSPAAPRKASRSRGYLTKLNEIRRDAPDAALAAQHHLPPRRRREHHGVLQATDPGRRHATTRSSSSRTSTRTAPASRRPPRHARARPRLPRRIAAQDLVTGASWHWGEHVYVRLGPETEPVHIVAIRRF